VLYGHVQRLDNRGTVAHGYADMPGRLLRQSARDDRQQRDHECEHDDSGAFGAAYLAALVSAPVPEQPPPAAWLVLLDEVPSQREIDRELSAYVAAAAPLARCAAQRARFPAVGDLASLAFSDWMVTRTCLWRRPSKRGSCLARSSRAPVLPVCLRAHSVLPTHGAKRRHFEDSLKIFYMGLVTLGAC
jgi:hypothetical protein